MREKEHRCPWCGAITDSLGIGRFRIQTCSNCKRQYTYHTDGAMYKIYIVTSIICYLIIIPLAIINIYLFMIIFFIVMEISAIFLKLASYKRVDDDKKFEHKKFKAKFRFTENKLSYIKCRYFLQDKNIIPVCFVDDNGIALSNTICICMEDTQKITNSEFDCIFSFLPLSAVTFDINDKNIKLYFYKDYKKAGEGIVFNQIESF